MKPVNELDKYTRDCAIGYWNALVSTIGVDKATIRVIEMIQEKSSSLREDYVDTLKYALELLNRPENSFRLLDKSTRKALAKAIASDYKNVPERVEKQEDLSFEEKDSWYTNAPKHTSSAMAYDYFPNKEPFPLEMRLAPKNAKKQQASRNDRPTWTTFHRPVLQLILEIIRLVQPSRSNQLYNLTTKDWDTLSFLAYVERELSSMLSKEKTSL